MLWRRHDQAKTVNLALQGGGAHGAVVWGALDRLLEDDRLEIEGVSGTSAGAINAVLLADGMAAGGREGARRHLAAFWRNVSEACEARRRARFYLPRPRRGRRLDLTSANVLFQITHRVLIPYNFNPKNMNPLRSVIEAIVDFDRVRASSPVKLFINATDVCSNEMRVFKTSEVTLDAVCASCCLPFLFKAVEIDGRHYWDGGFMGNPALFPLVYECDADDVLLLQNRPFGMSSPPVTAAEILERISQVSFASTLVQELRMISYLNDLVDARGVKRRAGLRRTHMHIIDAGPAVDKFPPTSKFNAEWDFFLELREIGRSAMDSWLAESFDSVGECSTGLPVEPAP